MCAVFANKFIDIKPRDTAKPWPAFAPPSKYDYLWALHMVMGLYKANKLLLARPWGATTKQIYYVSKCVRLVVAQIYSSFMKISKQRNTTKLTSMDFWEVTRLIAWYVHIIIGNRLYHDGLAQMHIYINICIYTYIYPISIGWPLCHFHELPEADSLLYPFYCTLRAEYVMYRERPWVMHHGRC